VRLLLLLLGLGVSLVFTFCFCNETLGLAAHADKVISQRLVRQELFVRCRVDLAEWLKRWV